MLHHDRDLFEQVILQASSERKIESGIIEKDYFVTLFLKGIVQKQPDIVFRGGTSLSKCFKLIDRFSEDIDLSVEGMERPTERQRKKLKENIMSVIEEYGFSLENAEEIRSRRDFNRYVLRYPSTVDTTYLKQHLIVETAVFFRAYPSQRMLVTNFLYEYLATHHHNELIAQYDLQPFEVNVQSAERTFIDKVYALCDYYLSGNTVEHSRHIYDLYKLLHLVSLDESLKELAQAVAAERKTNKTCLSVQEGVSISALLNEIVRKDAYKADYETITSSLLFESVPYEEVIKSLTRISESGVFD